MPVEGNQGENKLFARMEIKVLSPEALADSLEVALEGKGVLPAAAVRAGMKKGGGYPANTPRDHFVSFLLQFIFGDEPVHQAQFARAFR